jgi:hypothetical protein
MFFLGRPFARQSNAPYRIYLVIRKGLGLLSELDGSTMKVLLGLAKHLWPRSPFGYPPIYLSLVPVHNH